MVLNWKCIRKLQNLIIFNLIFEKNIPCFCLCDWLIDITHYFLAGRSNSFWILNGPWAIWFLCFVENSPPPCCIWSTYSESGPTTHIFFLLFVYLHTPAWFSAIGFFEIIFPKILLLGLLYDYFCYQPYLLNEWSWILIFVSKFSFFWADFCLCGYYFLPGLQAENH